MSPVVTHPARSLAVAASAPRYCAVCDGDRQMQTSHPGSEHGHVTRCPHCSPRLGTPIPIYIYPVRVDVPRRVAQ